MSHASIHATHHSTRVYSLAGLSLYDTLVMNIFAAHVWGCPSQALVTLYQNNLSNNHADIGVGTAYCLDRSAFSSLRPRIVLIDIRQTCLTYAARRLARYKPETYLRNACEPINIPTGGVDSLSLGGLIHCLPGDMHTKSRVFDAISPLLNANARVFGYSLVSDGVNDTRRRHNVHKFLNWAGVINNRNDRLADLHAELEKRFKHCLINRVGNIAFFCATAP